MPSLAFKSELAVSHLDSTIEEKDKYTVLKTSNNPNYYYGNLLCLKTGLDSQSLVQWQEEFNQQFKNLKGINHYTFSWNRADQEPNVKDYLNNGYVFYENHILSMPREQLKPTYLSGSNVTLKALTIQDDWQDWFDVFSTHVDGNEDSETWISYVKGMQKTYQQLSNNNFGQTVGAYIDHQLVGYAGLYCLDDIARFQQVRVVDKHQNKGIAKAMLTKLIDDAPSTINQFVIVADEHYHASGLYQSLGFSIAERECSLCWWPK